ncbi:MAG: flagellar protein FlgN [Planctomycetota bacterium]|jgi:hypothetical protein|nr:flagellar protein FlgN [Planctomycetota bacterium]
MNSDDCATELIRLLRAQTGVCRQILDKSARQRELVAGDGENDLLALLAEKQELLDRQRRLAAEAGPHREKWENSARARAPAPVRAEVEGAWNELRELFDRIVKLEDESQERLRERQRRLSVDIGNLQRGKIVNKAYGGNFRPPPPPRFGDKRG